MPVSDCTLRIAWFSPIDVQYNGEPIFSKSEYVSSVLLPILQENCEIELFSNRAGKNFCGLTSKHFLTAWSRHQDKPFDIFFYNLENGKHSDFTRLHLALVPGLTWFHDFTLIDDGPEPILNSPWSRMAEIFNNHPNHADIVWPSKKDQFLPIRPQALREVGMSFYSIFSAERDLEQFRHINSRRLNPSDRGTYLPMPLDSKNINFDDGLKTSSVFRVAACSSPNVESHIHSLLQAIAITPDLNFTWLIERSEKEKCIELLAEFDVKNATLIEGRNIEAWSNILKENDLAIHFLYTFYQQANPWLALSLAQGVFTAVLDFSESEYLPPDSAIRIYPGGSEVSQLRTVFTALSKSEIKRNYKAYSFARERYEARTVAEELMITFKRLAPGISDLQSKMADLLRLGRKDLLAQNLMIN